jgi:hypothetical protein
MDREVQVMVTPRVVEEVRNHFGCWELEGAELEDQGEEGTALTHWEKRVFEASSDQFSLPHFEAMCVSTEMSVCMKQLDTV